MPITNAVTILVGKGIVSLLGETLPHASSTTKGRGVDLGRDRSSGDDRPIRCAIALTERCAGSKLRHSHAVTPYGMCIGVRFNRRSKITDSHQLDVDTVATVHAVLDVTNPFPVVLITNAPRCATWVRELNHNLAVAHVRGAARRTEVSIARADQASVGREVG
jgi:hypothetical protein